MCATSYPMMGWPSWSYDCELTTPQMPLALERQYRVRRLVPVSPVYVAQSLDWQSMLFRHACPSGAWFCWS